MSEAKFQTGDMVTVTNPTATNSGQSGFVIGSIGDTYVVDFPGGGHFAYQADDLDFPTDDTESDEEESFEDELEVPEFGMSTEAFTAYLEFLLKRTLGKVGEVGPREVFFGFQEFEGQSPQEVLFNVLDKLEDTMAMTAQLHILVSRMGFALDQLGPSEENS